MKGVTRKVFVQWCCAALFALAVAVFFCLAIVGSILMMSAQTTERVPRSLDMGTYSVCYDSVLLIPLSADWTLSASCLGKTKRVPSWRFAEDTRLQPPRACHDDYTRSGWDRGHMCPAADRTKDVLQMRSTFVMSNVCPQSPTLNRGAWKRMEDACRAMARNGDSIRIHVDVVFWRADTERIGRHGVAVPHGFVKSVYKCSDDSLISARYFQNW